MSKPILCVDFDGVIHSYEHGWQDGEIYGTATPGFFAWAIKAVEHFELVVYSSRSKTPEGISAMREAIGKWSIDAVASGEVSRDFVWPELFDHLTFSDVKPPAFLTIDDRAICFLGSWKSLDPAELLQFRTWTQTNRGASRNHEFVDDWNRMVGTVANFAAKYDLPAPEMLFHRRWLDKMNSAASSPIAGTLIHMNVRIRFGHYEQRDVLVSYP